MKKKEEPLLPLRLVRDYSAKYPGAYALIDSMREKADLEWNKSRCYIPIAATVAIVEHYEGDNFSTDPSALAALASWRHYKEIYTFDNELAQELYSQSGDFEKIPVEVLEAMPFPCIYIALEDDDFQGFFVFWEQDIDVDKGITSDYELRFLTIGSADEGLGVYHLHIVGGHTIKESADRTAQRMMRSKESEIDIEFAKMIADMQSQVVSRLLQLVLYICAENADIVENPTQKEITRKPASGAPPKDVFREIRKWDVGYKVGSMIRHQKYVAPLNHTQGSAKRPHVRRGHYHHFWAGSEKDGTKRLILRWIAPIFVNGTSDDIIITDNIIK